MKFREVVRNLSPAEWDILMALRGPDIPGDEKYVTVVPLRWLLVKGADALGCQMTPSGPIYGYYIAKPSDMRENYKNINLAGMYVHFGEHIYAGYGALYYLAKLAGEHVLATECSIHIDWLKSVGLPGSYYADRWMNQ